MLKYLKLHLLFANDITAILTDPSFIKMVCVCTQSLVDTGCVAWLIWVSGWLKSLMNNPGGWLFNMNTISLIVIPFTSTYMFKTSYSLEWKLPMWKFDRSRYWMRWVILLFHFGFWFCYICYVLWLHNEKWLNTLHALLFVIYIY